MAALSGTNQSLPQCLSLEVIVRHGAVRHQLAPSISASCASSDITGQTFRVIPCAGKMIARRCMPHWSVRMRMQMARLDLESYSASDHRKASRVLQKPTPNIGGTVSGAVCYPPPAS